MKKQKVLKVLGVSTLIGVSALSLTSCKNPFDTFKDWIHGSDTPEVPKNDTGFNADNENHDYGETVDLPQNIVFKRNVAGQAATLNVRATVLPNTIVNKKLTWELVWTDGGSHGNIADYVTVAPSVDTLSAVITLKAGFNNQIKLVVKSQQDSSKQANCILDYQKRVTGIIDNKVRACWSTNPDEADLIYGNGSYNLDEITSDNLDDVWNNKTYAKENFRLIDYNGAVVVTGTTGVPELDTYVKFEFDDGYKNGINSNNFGASGWDSSEWKKLQVLDYENQAYLSLYDFEENTTKSGSVKGLYGFVTGTCTITVKFVGADGFEKIYSESFESGNIPSLTNVTGVQLDSSTYVF